MIPPEPKSNSALETLKTHGRSFHFASQFLGRVHANRAARLYAFCRYVDDLADEADNANAASIALRALDQSLATCVADSAEAQDLLSLADEVAMDLDHPRALISGVASDLGSVALSEESDLVRYAYHVAGVVGLMMCAVFDVRDPRAHPFAIDLGIAMQLTNIARDVAEDARMGRVYLPATWTGGLAAHDLVAPSPDTRAAAIEAIARLLSRADDYYRSGEAGMGYLPARARLAILVASRVYRAIGTRIAAQHYDVWSGRVVVSGPDKAAIAGRAIVDFVSRRTLHHKRKGHDPGLHIGLEGLTVSSADTASLSLAQ